MTPMIQTSRADAVLLRRAAPGDARDIARLYNQAYSMEGRAAKEQYPFPQVLEPGWIAEAVAGGSIAWVVAEAGGGLVGSTAAVRNIGGRRDRIAEVFGVVVSDEARMKGVATRLLDLLCAELGGEAEFILCEARTAEPGGWKVARNCGFLPVGFEPFAHAMPVGFESMVLTGRVVGDWSARPAVPPRLTPTAQVLALAVAGAGARFRPEGHGGASPDPVGNDPSSTPAGAPPAEPFEVRRDDEGGRRMLEGRGGDLDHRSGVIGLRPLEGEDREGRRYERPYFLGLQGDRVVGCARAVWDWTDRRARILDLRMERDGLQAGMLADTTRALLRMAGDGPLVVIVNVRADALGLQRDLEQLQFFPTSYYPGLIAVAGGRCDAVQYTHLHRRRIEEGLEFVTDIDWPRARSVIDQVLESRRCPPLTRAIRAPWSRCN
ncbi:MAG: GNAT family N-acetyltransferase [Acidimicrobiia bacterium]|nr:GNAT family N-acetyltransferase [Acidimicrobiia bacterium]